MSLNKKGHLHITYNNGTPYRIKNGTVFIITIKDNTIILLLDINNKIQKNITGKDVFLFAINNNNKIIPIGSGLPREVLIGKDKERFYLSAEGVTSYLSGWETCNKDLSDQRYGGLYCAALIMQDGWKITDDYPW